MTSPDNGPAQTQPPEDLTTEATFSDLGVTAQLVQALTEVGITHPFPIQEMSIPITLSGADLIGQARTGTGKTLAFGLPILQRVRIEGDEDFEELKAPGKPQALIMTPTRELALQITNDLKVAATRRKARILTIYGGVSYDEQLDTLKSGVDVVVGTPGRLLDLVNRRDLDLSHVRMLVLDEADEMLDLGFLPDVERLVARTPEGKQTMMFSATMPGPIVALARANMHQPVHVRAEGHDAQVTVPDTTQFIYQAHDLDKPEIIGKLLQASGVEKMMIFTRTKRAAQRVADDLIDRGFSATSIHGDLNQAAREKALRKFRRGEVRVLVATDVAARGIDVTGVSHVVNYECPDDAKAYVHRIGRTGRAGNKGVAVTLVDWADVTRWKVINKTLGLPFGDIAETYSTSPQLQAELNIPEGTRGRIAEGKPREHGHVEHDRRGRGHTRDRQPAGRRRDRQDNGDATRDGAKPAEKRERKPRRPRRRLRNGQPIGNETPEAQAGQPPAQDGSSVQ